MVIGVGVQNAFHLCFGALVSWQLDIVARSVEKLVTRECLGPKNWPKSVVLIDIDRHHHRSHHHLKRRPGSENALCK